jgi:hypothetical protein
MSAFFLFFFITKFSCSFLIKLGKTECKLHVLCSLLFEYYFVGVPGVALQRIQVQRDQPLQPDDLLQDSGQDKLSHRLLVTFRLLQG